MSCQDNDEHNSAALIAKLLATLQFQLSVICLTLILAGSHIDAARCHSVTESNHNAIYLQVTVYHHRGL